MTIATPKPLYRLPVPFVIRTVARTDQDTWDLASSVGATATVVAVGRALASRSPNALIDDPYAEPLVRAVGVRFFTRSSPASSTPQWPTEAPDTG